MNTSLPLLAPVIALVVWTAVMWAWMYATRIPAILAMRMKLDGNVPRGEQMATLPPRVRWKADNYNHLLEQPPLFYATALVLTLLGEQGAWAVGLAWAYVGLRVVHSIWQSMVNIIEVRFALFATMSIVLMALTARAVMLLP